VGDARASPPLGQGGWRDIFFMAVTRLALSGGLERRNGRQRQRRRQQRARVKGGSHQQRGTFQKGETMRHKFMQCTQCLALAGCGRTAYQDDGSRTSRQPYPKMAPITILMTDHGAEIALARSASTAAPAPESISPMQMSWFLRGMVSKRR